MEGFSHEYVNDNLVRIKCPGYVFAYLAIGTMKAALIDTGYGYGSIKEYVRTITDLPLTVILTHAHFDHSGGVMEFDNIFVAPEDLDVLKRDITIERRASLICDYYGYPKEGLFPPKEVTSVSLLDGMEFPLGGLTVKALKMGGHTKGSMCILFKEMRTVLFGDACNSYCMMIFEESSTVEEYQKALIDFKKYEKDYDTVLYSHPGNFGGKEILDEMIEVCEGVLDGTCLGSVYEPVTEREGIFYVAKERGENGRRADGKAANLLYEVIR